MSLYEEKLPQKPPLFLSLSFFSAPPFSSAVHLVYHFSSFHSLFKSSKTIEEANGILNKRLYC